tara:strand:- start:45 stop:464 length:420 start_codon:yes stop_codon:yes gene_type:complete
VTASFPSGLKPTSRSYRPGKFPQIQFEALNGATTAIRYGPRPFNAQLRLTFANIDDTDAARIVNHYEERMATFANVTFSGNDGLAGLGTADKENENLAAQIKESASGLTWRYAEPPQVESVYPGISTVTCTFTGYLDGV